MAGQGWQRADPTAAVAPERVRASRPLPPQPGLVAGALQSMNPALATLFPIDPGLARLVQLEQLVPMPAAAALVRQAWEQSAGRRHIGVIAHQARTFRATAQRLMGAGSRESVALVLVTAVVRVGTKADDQIDVTVTTVGSAKSLEGGQLFLTPLRGPTNGNAIVFGIAEGPMDLENPATPTRGRVTRGARMIEDVSAPPITDSFDLILDEVFKSYQAASHVAEAINAAVQLSSPDMAGLAFGRGLPDTVPGIGSDIKDPNSKELAYAEVPVVAFRQVYALMAATHDLLPRVKCPTLVITAREDHVVSPTNGPLIAAKVGANRVEMAWLENSYHVATIDNDKALIAKLAIDFIKSIAGR